MFTKKTVFIVGAGASAEVDLPVGEKLKSIIGKKTNLFYHDYDENYGDPNIRRAIYSLVNNNNSNGDPEPYLSAGRQITSSMPLSLSIDNYLHTHNKNKELMQMGKLGIASSILEAESNSFLATNINKFGRLSFEELPETWHTTFFKMLTEDVNKSDLENIFDNVSIISFNYDRCIQHYLVQALANYFGLDFIEAQKIVSRLTIIHPYGQVGMLPWQGGEIDFGEKPNPNSLLKIADQINTFTEYSNNTDSIDRLVSVLKPAGKVVFLGFSFGEINMKLLKRGPNATSPKVYGSAFGLSESNKKIAEKGISKYLHVPIRAQKYNRIILSDTKCNNLLKDYYGAITRG